MKKNKIELLPRFELGRSGLKSDVLPLYYRSLTIYSRHFKLLNLIQEAKKTDKERKFKQALELYLVFKDIDVKKGFALNEVIQLPKKMAKPAAVCVMATGDMSLKAKNANADQVIDNTELTTLA